MIDVVYICNRNKDCRVNASCGKDCIHTCDPTYAKNEKTIKLISDLMNTFDYNGDIRLTEKKEVEE